jgi:aldose 1-epimerase
VSLSGIGIWVAVRTSRLTRQIVRIGDRGWHHMRVARGSIESMRIPPSGEQFEIRHGDQRATIVEVGGAIREYYAGDRAVLDPFSIDKMADGAHGNPLVPWPNRLEDGKYEWDGATLQGALTEPEKHNAIHGLLRWHNWVATERDESRVLMHARIHPQTGYPFILDVSVAYALTDDGLVVTTTATNLGETACPYGTGQHPYLSPGEGLIDECELQFAAATRIDTDDERQLPTGRVPVAGTDFDFSEPRRVGDFQMDYAFTDLAREQDGRAYGRLKGADRATVELWLDENYDFLEVFTGDSLAPERARRGLGCEPMTCAPNAFNSGDGLIRLEPGESYSAVWGVRLR